MTKLAEQFGKFSSVANQNRNQYGQSRRSSGLMNTFKISSDGNYDGNLLLDEKDFKETTHQLHVYATRHNVHITLARPPGFVNKLTGAVSKDRTVAISVSAGNMGFRHSARKHYDSAFQLASLVMAKIKGDGIITDIQQLEVFLRGFGAGREAVTRALLGIEGASLRGKIIKVSDATRLKFGGTRSKKPRRLG
jgi:small subunit ribosomal protein S11